MFESQERYFDWITPAGNTLIGLLQLFITALGAFGLQQFGFPMFNFVAPWLPLIALIAFLTGMACFKRRPDNAWILALEVNVPALLLGIVGPFFWLGTCLSVLTMVAGIGCGRKLFRQLRRCD